MKTIWNMLSFLAVVNLLALLAFLGWLWQSDRLTGERVQQVREILSPTVAEVEKAAKEAEAAEAEAAEVAVTADMEANPSAASESTIARRDRVDSRVQVMIRRLDEEQRLLAQGMSMREQLLDKQQAEFAAEREQWQTALDASNQRKIDDQFKKVLRTLESIPPKQAKQILKQLVDDGESDEAVAYLDAMKPASSADVLAQFKTDDESRMAKELLQRLQTYGLEAGTTEITGNADADSIPAP